MDDEQHHEPERLVANCGYPGCCMPGLHFPSECHNAQDVIAAIEEEQRDEDDNNHAPDIGADLQPRRR